MCIEYLYISGTLKVPLNVDMAICLLFSNYDIRTCITRTPSFYFCYLRAAAAAAPQLAQLAAPQTGLTRRLTSLSAFRHYFAPRDANVSVRRLTSTPLTSSLEAHACLQRRGATRSPQRLLIRKC